MSGSTGEDAGGCAGCFAAFILIALVVSAVVSLAALIDPFDWMPSVSEVWEDCDGDRCDLADRFPGFWVHVIVNLAWAIATSLALLLLMAAVTDLRQARAERFDTREAASRYPAARWAVAGAAVAAGALGLLPIAVAVL